MGRKKEFVREEALQKAKEVFWQYGYESTSMKTLAKGMAMNPFSIYQAFGSKEKLYCEILSNYHGSNFAFLTSIFDAPVSPLQKVKNLFEHVKQEIIKDTQGNGCMMVNAIGELCGHLESVDAIIAQNEREVMALFEKTVRQGQEQGEFDTKSSSQQLSAFLFASFQGMRTFGKINRSDHLINGVKNSIITAISA
ncbi:MAG: TetR/AcrR family transcriptional regulator [Pricia sp.]